MAITAQEAQTTLPGGLAGAMQQGPQGAGRIYTFREAAALRRQSAVVTIPFASGQPFNQELRHVGYLARLYLRFTLALIVTGAAGTVTETQDSENYLPLLQILTPSNNSPLTLSFRSLTAFNYTNRPAVNPRQAPGYAGWTPGTAATYNVEVQCRLPLALNMGRNFATGLIARNSQQSWYLSGRFCAAGDLVGAGTSVVTFGAGALEIGEVWYDAVGLQNVIPPDFLIATRLREATKQTLQIGDNTYPYPTPGPTLLNALMGVYLNSVLDHVHVDRLQLQADGEYPFVDLTSPHMRNDDYYHFAQVLPTGWFEMNFFDDTEVVNETLGRDQIDATLYSQLLFNVRVLSTATTTNSKVVSLYRELVDLQTPAIGRAA
jgi:hypothetical protein